METVKEDEDVGLIVIHLSRSHKAVCSLMPTNKHFGLLLTVQ